MALLFWCEFSDKVDWKELDSLLKKQKLKIRAYVACSSRKDFLKKKRLIETFKSIHVEGAWPVLPKEKGYWFSSFTSKKDIDLLDEFSGIPIKIDIEPPIPLKQCGTFGQIAWLLKYLFVKPVNMDYVIEKARRLSKKGSVIVSTFPFPPCLLKRYGWFSDDKMQYNYIFYSTMVPSCLRWLYRLYYRGFAKKRLKETPDAYFAVGLITHGIFGKEGIYSNVSEFKSDISFLKSLGVKNFVVFQLSRLQDRCDREEFLEEIKNIHP